MSNRKKFVHSAENYDSDFEPDERRSKRAKQDVVFRKPVSQKHIPRTTFPEEVSKEYGRMHKNQFLSLDVYSRHKQLINHYVLSYPGTASKLQRDRSKDKTDSDVIKENHQFLWEENEGIDTWEKQLAKKYYDKLYKEYCLADLSHFKKKKIAMRWRVEKEVLSGKGQFSCGNIKCEVKNELKTWEVNFAYIEESIKKNALVKLRLCPDCSCKMKYCHKDKDATRNKRSEKCAQRQIDSQNIGNKVDDVSIPSRSSSSKNTVESAEHEVSDGSKKDNGIWKQPVQQQHELGKSRDEEFEEFLSGLLL